MSSEINPEDGWIVFESDADLDHWLNMLDRETVFEIDLPAHCPETPEEE